MVIRGVSFWFVRSDTVSFGGDGGIMSAWAN